LLSCSWWQLSKTSLCESEPGSPYQDSSWVPVSIILSTMPEQQDPMDAVVGYHSRTKHHMNRFAASLGYLDWATQPNPFRTFESAQRVELPLSADSIVVASYDELYSSAKVGARSVDLESIGAFFELALGLSAWKQYQQTRWSLRCNPSSGNLHPTEGYAIFPAIDGLKAGVYHYVSRHHCLERRCTLEHSESLLPSGSFLVGLSSIHWREAWKYGERAFRYCQHDLGHAIGTVRYAAAALGWSAKLLDVSDDALSDLLGLAQPESFATLEKEEREHPGALLIVGPDEVAALAPLREALNRSTWSGHANILSPQHVAWPAIDTVAEATWVSDPVASDSPIDRTWGIDIPFLITAAPDRLGAAQLIRQRRSAVALDDSTSIPAPVFYRILDRLLPRPGVPPWDVLHWPPHVHCGIFVHRVEGLDAGLYLFERSPQVHPLLKSALSSNFAFEHVEGCPSHLSLFKLTDGDFRQTAQLVSCRQQIAGAGAFSLGMIAEFSGSLQRRGASWYRRLFWEAGLLGQVLYLEAEAAGIRGTGIGCYFDDVFHRLLGLEDDAFQSLYHFTMGGPVDDERLMTLPAYDRKP